MPPTEPVKNTSISQTSIVSSKSAVKRTLKSGRSYPFNPFSLILSLRKGQYNYRKEDISVQFRTSQVWETVSLFHTLKKESSIFTSLQKDLHPDDVFYDIGAHQGAFTCFAEEVLSDGKTVAFEPHPENIARLRDNIQLNKGSSEIFEYALSSSEGSGRLLIERGWRGNQRHSLATPNESGATIPVEVVTGDSLVEEGVIPSPDVIKIDVEGAEMEVLRGLESSISQNCRVIYVELHPRRMERYGSSPSMVVQMLERSGFKVEEIPAGGSETYIRAERTN